MRVELVARRVQLADLVVEGLQDLVIINRGNAGSELAVDELVLPQRAGQEVELNLESFHYCAFLLLNRRALTMKPFKHMPVRRIRSSLYSQVRT